MGRVFKIAEQDVVYQGNIDEYNAIKARLNTVKEKSLKTFLQNYDNGETAEKFLAEGVGCGLVCIDKAFMSFADIFIARGIYNFDLKLLENHPQYDWMLLPYESVVNDYSETYNSIVNEQESEKERRYIRKESRGRIIGGGFGVGGAVKGMAVAGAINLGTGLMHGAYNMIGNALTDFNASSEKEELYKNGRSRLRSALEVSIDNLMEILSNLLGLDKEIDFDFTKSKAIMDNIKCGRIKGEQILPAYLNIFQFYPYGKEFYCKFIETFPQYEKDALVLANYFFVDLEDFIKEIHEVNGFYFEDVAEAQKLRKEYEKFAKIINKDMESNFSYIVHNTDYLFKKNEPAYIFYLIKYYTDLMEESRDDTVATAYYEYLIKKFQLLRGQIVQTYGAVKTTYSELEINLSKTRMRINNDKIFIGPEYVDPTIREVAINNSMGLISPNSSFYLLVDGDSQLVLCSEGLVKIDQNGRNNAIINLEEALNFSAEFKDGMLSKNININGREIFETSEFEEKELKLVVQVLQVLFPVVAFNEKQHKLEIAPEVSDITFIGKCYEYGCGTQANQNLALKCYSRAALYNDGEAQYILAQKYHDEKSPLINYGKAKFWLYSAARAGNRNALLSIMENKRSINDRQFADINTATAGDEFKEALDEMQANGYGLSALEADTVALESINKFSVLERIIATLQRIQSKITTSNYYCAPTIPAKKLNNVLASYGAGINLELNDILLLFDPTTFGGAKEGFIFTKEGILTDQRVYVRYDEIRDLQYQNNQFFVLLKNMPEYASLYESSAGVEQSNILFAELHKLFENLERG